MAKPIEHYQQHLTLLTEMARACADQGFATAIEVMAELIAEHEKAIAALEHANIVIDYCGGDAWERECTEDDRAAFHTLYEQVVPIAVLSEDHTVDYLCACCGKAFVNAQAVRQHERDKHGPLRMAEGWC